MNDYVADTRQRLLELNRLEHETAICQKAGRSSLNSEALMESLRANMPLKFPRNGGQGAEK